MMPAVRLPLNGEAAMSPWRLVCNQKGAVEPYDATPLSEAV